MPTQYERAAEAVLQGLPQAQIAVLLGVSIDCARGYISLARKRGLLPPVKRQTRGSAWYYAKRRYKAVPRLGNISEMLDLLGVERVQKLVARVGKHDDALIDTITGIVQEALDGRSDP